MTKGFTMIVFQDSSTQNHIKKEENRLPRRLHSPHRKAIKVELIQIVSLFQEVEGVERVGDVPCSATFPVHPWSGKCIPYDPKETSSPVKLSFSIS